VVGSSYPYTKTIAASLKIGGFLLRFILRNGTIYVVGRYGSLWEGCTEGCCRWGNIIQYKELVKMPKGMGYGKKAAEKLGKTVAAVKAMKPKKKKKMPKKGM
jgi:hypothetical protein